MQAKFDLSSKQRREFEARCIATINRVGNGSRKALLAACEAISVASLEQVPRDTDSLANSQYYEITGDYRTGWEADIGYGKPDNINPKTGEPVSSYMLAVHENVTAQHPIGKAKFLEDPVREWALAAHPRTTFKTIYDALQGK